MVEAKKHLFQPRNAIQRKIGRIVVAADDAHAFGAKWHGKMAGEIADFSSFSFHAVKNLTTAEGGALKDLPVAVLNHYGEDHSGSGHLYITRLLGRSDEERRAVIIKMAERGIACNVHYKPLPMMTAYKALGFDIKDYPNAYNLFVNEVTLPLHTRLTDEDVEYVTSNFVDIVKNL